MHNGAETEERMRRESRYRAISAILVVTFAAAGILFLFLPQTALEGMNSVSRMLGMRESPVHGASLYVILASAYMYLVTLFAWKMMNSPANKIYPALLVQGKSASALVSLALFVFHAPYLIFLANAIVDGVIAAGVWMLRRKIAES